MSAPRLPVVCVRSRATCSLCLFPGYPLHVFAPRLSVPCVSYLDVCPLQPASWLPVPLSCSWAIRCLCLLPGYLSPVCLLPGCLSVCRCSARSMVACQGQSSCAVRKLWALWNFLAGMAFRLLVPFRQHVCQADVCAQVDSHAHLCRVLPVACVQCAACHHVCMHCVRCIAATGCLQGPGSFRQLPLASLDHAAAAVSGLDGLWSGGAPQQPSTWPGSSAQQSPEVLAKQQSSS